MLVSAALIAVPVEVEMASTLIRHEPGVIGPVQVALGAECTQS